MWRRLAPWGWASSSLLLSTAAALAQPAAFPAATNPPAAPRPALAGPVPPAVRPATAATIPPPPRGPATPARAEDGVRWQSLTPAQRDTLAPLEREWPSIEAPRKQKWISIADRYKTLPPEERTRISARMVEWARLTPAERGEVRLRYQEAKQVSAGDRSARWQAYQSLPAEEKEKLAARAAVPSASRAVAVAPRARADTRDAKSNVVPNPALVQPPRSVAPTVVQASPGATTRLITRPEAPPPHQQSGMPKVATTPEFVNRTTLLPRRGPQAAAVTPLPPAQPGQAEPTLRR